MSDIDDEMLEQLMRLSRIRSTEEEKKKLRQGLQNIIASFEQLREIDTEGVPPCHHVLATFANAMREDEVGPLLSREDFLANAPSHVGGMIRVPPIMKDAEP
ncbi:MAG: Asp-tRNA(Asn)/Glu-tRNA(Gln) amidotransferase subunit GatC [Anaerolineae bacterium]